MKLFENSFGNNETNFRILIFGNPFENFLWDGQLGSF